MFPFNGYYFYISIALQIFCVIHCLRKGKPAAWILAITFLPVIGCLVYLFTQVFRGGELGQLQSGVGKVFNPAGSIKKLESQLRFSDTFNNKVALADACLAAGKTERAIGLYENSLQGAFTENEYVLAQLVIAYNLMERYAAILPLAKKIYNLPQFKLSRVHILYAIALDKTGNHQLAEKEFLSMKVRYANFESRYEYGMFLTRAGRNAEAVIIFREIMDDYGFLSSPEKRSSRKWVGLAKEQAKKLNM